jgi:hypothetical protein
MEGISLHSGNKDGRLTNGSISMIAIIVKNVVSPASKAKFAVQVINAQAPLTFTVASEEAGHKGAGTRLINDNGTAYSILEGTIGTKSKERH